MLQAMARQVRRGAIGVSLETDAVRMAESRGGRISRCASVAYPPDMSREREGIAVFLKHALREFTPALHRLPVWAVGCFPSLHVRYMNLPALRSGSVSDMVYWTFRNELPFDGVRTLFDYGIEGGGGSGPDGRINVTAYTASRSDTDALAALFAAADVRLAGIVIPAFAMRNMMRLQMDGQPSTRLGLFVGEDASTVIVVKAGQVHSSRVIKTGMNAMLAVVREHDPGCTAPVAYHLMQEALALAPDGAVAKQVHEVFDRLVLQIERTMAAGLAAHPDEQFDGLHVMGPIAGLAPLVAVLKSRLGLPVPEETDGRNAGELPELTALAAGASLSRRDRTPNLLNTCAERERAARRARWSVQAALLLALLLVLLHAGGGLLERRNTVVRERLRQEQSRLADSPAQVDAPAIERMVVDLVEARLRLKRLFVRWLPLGMLRALAELTPPTIRLTAIDAVFPGGGPVQAGAKSRQTGQGTGDGAVLRLFGRVLDAPEEQRSALAAYAIRLEDSPLFTRVEVTRVIADGDSSALSFELTLVSDGLAGADARAPLGGEP